MSIVLNKKREKKTQSVSPPRGIKKKNKKPYEKGLQFYSLREGGGAPFLATEKPLGVALVFKYRIKFSYQES